MGKDRYENTCRFGGFEFIEEQKRKGNAVKIGFSFHDDAKLLDKILTDILKLILFSFRSIISTGTVR